MANDLLHYRNYTTSTLPAAGSISQGELAIHGYNDGGGNEYGAIFIKNSIGSRIRVGEEIHDTISGFLASTTLANARTFLGVDATGTDNSIDVTLAGTPNYITISGQELTLAQIDLTTDVAGDLPFGNLAQVAANSILGNNTGSLANASALSGTQVTALLDNFATGAVTPGLVPGANGATGSYLRGDGTWQTIPGSANSFETITVDDTDTEYTWSETGSAVSTSASDTLTLVGGTDIDIDVDPALDAIRIAFSGTLTTTLAALTDTTITGPVTSDLLQWNGSAWVDRTLAEAGVQAAGNELAALQALADTAGFLKKTGDGAYSIDTATYATTAAIANMVETTDSNASSWSFVVDQDDMASNSANLLPTQQSVKAYVDAVATGMDWKDSVRVATDVTGALATAFENGDTVDGVVLATNDRILLKDQSTGSQNGIYTVNATGAPTRATDADENAEVTTGLAVFVEEGTANGGTGWVMVTSGAIVVDTTALSFTQFSGSGTYTASLGVKLVGNDFQFDINAGLTAETTVDGTADYLPIWDNSATGHRKVLVNNLPMDGGTWA